MTLSDKQRDLLERVAAERDNRFMDAVTIMNGLGAIADILLAVKPEPVLDPVGGERLKAISAIDKAIKITKELQEMTIEPEVK